MQNTPFHQNPPVAMRGMFEGARAALILLHGRGNTAESILSLADEVIPEEALTSGGIVALAPQAAGNSWYPHRFLRPLAENEPLLSSALATVTALIAQTEMRGIPTDRILIGGFSQGACLALEVMARHARRCGGVFAFSGALIGPTGTPHGWTGSFAGTPILLGSSDIDEHVPLSFVQESAEVLKRMGAAVDLRVYPSMAHTINTDEIAALRAMVAAVLD